MWGKIVTSVTNYALKRVNLTIEQRNSIVTNVLDALDALPLKDIITTSPEGELSINGRPVSLEVAQKLRESALAAVDNTALKVIKEQVAFAAVALGVHTVESERQMLFARAAIWYHQQLDKHLKILAVKE